MEASFEDWLEALNHKVIKHTTRLDEKFHGTKSFKVNKQYYLLFNESNNEDTMQVVSITKRPKYLRYTFKKFDQLYNNV